MATPASYKKPENPFDKLLAGATHEQRRRARQERLMAGALASLYGEEGDEAELEGELTGAPPSAHLLATLLPTILHACSTPEHETLRELVARWAEIVGPEVARRTAPRRLQDKTLVVEVADSVTRFSLQGQLPALTQKVSAFTRQKVQVLRLQAGGQTATTRTRTMRRPEPPPPPQPPAFP